MKASLTSSFSCLRLSTQSHMWISDTHGPLQPVLHFRSPQHSQPSSVHLTLIQRQASSLVTLTGDHICKSQMTLFSRLNETPQTPPKTSQNPGGFHRVVNKHQLRPEYHNALITPKLLHLSHVYSSTGNLGHLPDYPVPDTLSFQATYLPHLSLKTNTISQVSKQESQS